ncbi:N-acetyltransferase GNAT family [Penicillium herquei]|nr:N-acetyltransferase GNAT family [Penicillium herquei]
MEDAILPHQSVRVLIPSPGPSIESTRLLLRPVEARDFPALLAVRGNPEVAKTNYPKTPFKSIEETAAWISSKIFSKGPDDVIGRSFNYSILDKSIPESEEQVIGYVSINTLSPCPEIGYSLLQESWGKGYATEALEMLLKMWWDLPRRPSGPTVSVEVEKIFAICEKENPGSCRVLKKCGFEVVKEFRYEVDELYIWSLNRPDQVVDSVVKYRYRET